jgi:hypothetical protein
MGVGEVVKVSKSAWAECCRFKGGGGFDGSRVLVLEFVWEREWENDNFGVPSS